MKKISLLLSFLIVQLWFAQSDSKLDSLQLIQFVCEQDSVLAIGNNNVYVFFEKKESKYNQLSYCKLNWCDKVTEFPFEKISVNRLQSFLKPEAIEKLLAMMHHLNP